MASTRVFARARVSIGLAASVCLTAAASLSFPETVRAQFTPTSWTGAVDGSWSEAGNWTGGIPIATTEARFDANSTDHRDVTLSTSALTPAVRFSSGVPGSVTVGGTGSIGTMEVHCDDTVYTHRIDVNVESAGELRCDVAGNLEMREVSGTAMLKKYGAGTLTLSGNNTYTGGATLYSGTVVAGNDGAFGTGTIHADSGTIQSDNDARSLANNVTIVNYGAIAISGSNNLALTGTIDGGGSFIKEGTGTLTLSGNNTYAANTVLRGGTVVAGHDSIFGSTLVYVTADSAIQSNDNARTLANDFSFVSSSLTVSGGNDLTLSGDISGSGSVTKTGDGTLILSGSNSYGATIVERGTLRLGKSYGLPDGGDVTVAEGAVFDANDKYQNIGVLDGAGNVLLGGSANNVLTVASGSFSGEISELGTLRKTSSGTLTLSGNNTYTGGTILEGGTVVVGHDSAFGTAAVSVNNDATIQSNNDARSIGNTFSLSIGKTLTVSADNDLALTGLLGGGGSLTKTGTGTLTVSNSNLYFGGTAIENGTLRLEGGDDRLATNGNVTVADGAVFDLNGNSQTIVAVGGAGSVLLGSSGKTLTVTTGTFSGVISEAGSLVKTGTGMLTLSGNNTYTGGTTLNGGTIVAGHDNALGTAAVQVTANGAIQSDNDARSLSNDFSIGNGGMLIVLGSNSLALTGTLDGAGSLGMLGTGTLTLSGNNTYTGNTTLDSGTIVAGHDKAFSSGTVQVSADATIRSNDDARSLANDFTLASDQTLTVSGSNNLALTGVLSGDGSLAKNGTGTLTLSGNNTYTGATAVNGGTLVVDGALSGSDLTVASGARLRGSGTLKSLNNAGILAPGNSIGTTTISGDYTAANGSVTEIEVNEAGLCDFVEVGGTATIASGAVLKAVPLYEVTETREYKFMTADSYSGEFKVLDTSAAHFTAEIRGDDYYLTILRIPFVDIARTGNEYQLASYLERNYRGATGDFKSILNALTGLPTDGDVCQAMDQLDGELYPTLSVANLQAASNFNRMIADQLRPGLNPVFYRPGGVYRGQCSRCCDWSGWTAGYGLGGNAASDGNAHGYTFSTGGMAAGIDRRLDYETRLGLFYGNGFASTVLDGLADGSTIHSNVWGLYLKRRTGDSYWTTIADLGHDDYVSRRNIAFGNINRTAESRHGGWQSTIYNELGHTFYAGPRLGVQPYTALQYIYIRQNGFTETGADSVNLDVGGNDLDSLRTILGGRLIANPGGALFGCSELAFRTHWTHELLDRTTGLVGADFAGVGTPGFAVRGVDLGRDWVTTGTDAVWKHGAHLQLRLSYEITYNAAQAYHTGGGSVGLIW